MAGDILPGGSVRVTVSRRPTNEAASKTLSRIFLRDPANRKLRRQRKQLLTRVIDVRRRGGRPWRVRSKAPRLVQPNVGDACTISATPDVLGDLSSVSRFVDVKPV